MCGGRQVLAADGKAGQLQQAFHPLRLSPRRQLEVVEGLDIILFVAVIVGPVPLDLRPLVGRSLLGEVGSLGELGAGVVVATHVGEGLAVEGAGQGRARRRLDGRRSVSGGGLDIIAPVFDPGQDGEDEAIVRGDLLRFERFVERGFLLRLVVEDQRVGGVIHGVLRVSADELLQLSGGRRVLVLKHQVQRGLRAGPAWLGGYGVAGGQ